MKYITFSCFCDGLYPAEILPDNVAIHRWHSIGLGGVMKVGGQEPEASEAGLFRPPKNDIVSAACNTVQSLYVISCLFPQ